MFRMSQDDSHESPCLLVLWPCEAVPTPLGTRTEDCLPWINDLPDILSPVGCVGQHADVDSGIGKGKQEFFSKPLVLWCTLFDEEMNWTTQKPTISGWYWWRESLQVDGSIVQVDTLDGTVTSSGTNEYRFLDEIMAGEWFGPLEQPE